MADPHLYIEVIAKHLPPSASTLRLLDHGGATRHVLGNLRDDLEITPAVGRDEANWSVAPNTMDAFVALDTQFEDIRFLEAALRVLRPGGRLIGIRSEDNPREAYVRMLENAGYTRILVEAVYNGVLIRGEKPHTEQRTLDRIQQVASRDANLLDLASYSGRYLHLLIRQTPNKPIWRLAPGEQIQWQALALENGSAPVLLAFSSLPKAVAFMQPAIMAGRIKDVNKVAKFSRETARQWTLSVLLNPRIGTLEDSMVALVPVDPQTAEAPDE
jgi:hypothetical protein